MAIETQRGNLEIAQCQLSQGRPISRMACKRHACAKEGRSGPYVYRLQGLEQGQSERRFPTAHIDVLVDNTAGHKMQSFMDGFSGYNQIRMAEVDMEKTSFITPWGVFCYRVMPFGLKIAGTTYQRAMTILFHDLMHQEVEVYVDDMIAKSKESEDHLACLRKLFDRLRR